MTRRQWIVTIIAACAVAVASYTASTAIAARRTAGSGMGMGPGMTPVVQYLQLTAEQQGRVKPIDETFRQNQMAACTKMQDARAKLLDILEQPTTRKADLNAALAEVSSAQAGMQRQTAEYLLEIKPILTADQRDRLFSLVGQRFCGQGRCGAGMCPADGGPGRRGRGRMW